MDVTDNAQQGSALGRRSLLGASLAGAAISLVVSRRNASAADPAPTAPLRPTDDDIVLLGFAQSVEMAARALYDIALNGSAVSGVERDVFNTIRESHDAYVQSISGLLGRDAPQEVADDVIALLEAGFGGSVTEALEAASLLESTAVATHRDILGQLEGLTGAQLVASILIIEARHGTVLAALSGKSDLDDLLVSEEAAALAAKG
jgi:hypothetical protein